MMKMLAFVLAATACGAPKRAAVPVSEAPTFHLDIDDAHAEFDAPGWSLLPGRKTTDRVVLVRPGQRELAIAVWIEVADPGETVEEVVVHWAKLLLSIPAAYVPTGSDSAARVSDEEAMFTVRGVDERGRKMSSICRIKLISGHGEAVWAIIYTAGLKEDAQMLSAEADRIIRTFHIVKPPSPK